MANDLNRCEFIGRLGRDPESRYTPSGDQVVNFSLAVDWKTKDKEGVEWINVVAFGKLAQICADYLSKGKQVYIAGRYNTQKWQDKETGQDRYSTRIIADQMQMLGGREDGEQQAAPQRQQQRTQAVQQPAQNAYQNASQGGGLADMDSDIPFAAHGAGRAWSVV